MAKLMVLVTVALLGWFVVGKASTMVQNIESNRMAQIDKAVR